MDNWNRIDWLASHQHLPPEEIEQLLTDPSEDTIQYLFNRAAAVRKQYYGTDVYVRGLIEISSYCRNNCYYCGIRKGNTKAQRYRLSKEEILLACRNGYKSGFRTFVLQGGEDPYFTDLQLIPLIQAIKKEYPDCALTLSLGERSRDSYLACFQAGADRYLLRHETANPIHYRQLHPTPMSWEHRIQCLYQLKEIGYQVGCGFMVGTPGQTKKDLAQEVAFAEEFRPHMIGIGPFLPHSQTPFAQKSAGTLQQTLMLLALLRLTLPKTLLPATTALNTLTPGGREAGILAGANVIMPNLSPPEVRGKYQLYDNKLSVGLEAIEGFAILKEQIKQIGYQTVVARGDSLQ